MNKLKFNPDNAKYYSEEFIKGFECGVERQFNADKAEPKTAEWEYNSFADKWRCNKCFQSNIEKSNFCPNCGARMKGDTE